MRFHLRPLVRRYATLLIVLVVALALSTTSFLLARHWEASRAFSAFRGISSDRVHAIREEIRNETSRLRLLVAYYESTGGDAAADTGNRRSAAVIDQFRSIVRQTMLADRAVVTVALIRRVVPANGDMIPSSGITMVDTAGDIIPASAQSSYLPIIAAEPIIQQSRVYGLDLYQSTPYREAMQRAIASGVPVATAPVRLVGSVTTPVGYWIFAPVYRHGPGSMASSASGPVFDGFVAVAYDATRMIERSISGLNPAGVDILLRTVAPAASGTDQTEYAFVPARTRRHSEANTAARTLDSSLYTLKTTFQLAGQHWQAQSYSAPYFVNTHTYWLSWAVLAAGLVTTFSLVTFLFWNLRRTDRVEHLVTSRTAELTEIIRQHQETEANLQSTHNELSEQMETTRRHAGEIQLLSDMGELLQTCQKVSESYTVVARFAHQLFPNEDGGLYVYSTSRTSLELVMEFGNGLGAQKVMEADQCWALRRAKPHYGNIDDDILHCDHVDPTDHAQYLCLPLMAQGETIGLLHVRQRTGIEYPVPLDESKRRLLVAVAEHAALAIANLSLRERLRQQSIRDPLTGLYNRRHMEDSLEREIHRARRTSNSLAILIADIDHFKKFNDVYGHEAGDLVLRQVAGTIEQSIRAEDIPCRFGGEEFVIILPGASIEDGTEKAEGLRTAIGSQPVTYGGKDLPEITVSIGIALFPAHGESGQDVLHHADEALYRAKKEGRNRVIKAEPGPSAA